MPIDDLDHAPAALLRYLYDARRTGVGIERLLEMGMITTYELAELMGELERTGLVRVTGRAGVPEAQITDEGIAWVRSRYADA